MMLNVVEKFVSINGEGRLAGQLAVFIRFAGCNLDCSYCDTRWANEENAAFEAMSADEIYRYIKSTGVENVTLTGGEPLLQSGIKELLDTLSGDESLSVEIETNGSVPLSFPSNSGRRPSYTMDYKLAGSGMQSHMLSENFRMLTSGDTVKFVCSDISDLETARNVILEYGLLKKVGIYISPVFGLIDPKTIVQFMAENRMNGVNLQLQLHKIIWDPNEKGV